MLTSNGTFVMFVSTTEEIQMENLIAASATRVLTPAEILEVVENNLPAREALSKRITGNVAEYTAALIDGILETEKERKSFMTGVRKRQEKFAKDLADSKYIPWGKHAGKTVEQVWEENPNWIKWFLGLSDLNRAGRMTRNYIRECTTILGEIEKQERIRNLQLKAKKAKEAREIREAGIPDYLADLLCTGMPFTGLARYQGISKKGKAVFAIASDYKLYQRPVKAIQAMDLKEGDLVQVSGITSWSFTNCAGLKQLKLAPAE
jgi:hypothetical protein